MLTRSTSKLRARFSALFALLLIVGASAGCKTVRAETPIERPTLEVPPPPARVIDPVLAEGPPPDTPIEPVAHPPAPAGKPRPPQVQAPKPEAKPETPPDPPPAATPPPVQTPELRTPGLSSGPEASRQIRAALDRTANLLRNTNYQALSGERRNSYDTAMRFMQEGEKELKANNFVLAKEHADKAERLAKELSGR